MVQRCSIHLSEVPLEATLEDLGSAELDVFFALGIVNPRGPTLTYVAAVGAQHPGASLPLVRVMLNPFAQRVDQIGRFKVGEVWNPAYDFIPLFELEFWDCPTLVLLNLGIPDEDHQPIATALLKSFGEPVILNYQRVRKHFGDPWSRVSAVIAGNEIDSEGISLEEASAGLAGLVLTPAHIKNEMKALSAAWYGSIEKTGIPDEMRRGALGVEQFKRMFFDRILPSLWLPDLGSEQDEPEPTSAPPRRLHIKSWDHLHSLLESREWVDFDEQRLIDLLRCTLLVYGKAGDTGYIRHLSALYRHALDGGLDSESRLLLESEMVELVETGKCVPVVFLPFLVEDSDHAVVAKAAIDFVSTSPYLEGQLYALTELQVLFRQNALGDRGAVFGALVAMGDAEILGWASKLRDELTVEEVRRAAKVHTFFPQHHAIQFWLGWCKELVSNSSSDALAKFGSCASALVLMLKHDRVKQVSEGKRNFPCHENALPITLINQWSLEDYANRIADDMYALESQEDAPRVFSSVLRAWGLQPRAPLQEQHIEDAGEDQEEFVRLRDPSASTREPAADRLLRQLLARE